MSLQNNLLNLLLSEKQYSIVQKNLKKLNLLSIFTPDESTTLLFLISDLELSDTQYKILNQLGYKKDIVDLCKSKNLTTLSSISSIDNEQALLVLCYKLHYVLLKNKNIDLSIIKYFIVEKFDLLNKYKIYDALVQKFIMLNDNSL